MTGSRESILRAIRANRPERVALPERVPAIAPDRPLIDRFAALVEGGGGHVVQATAGEVGEALLTAHPGAVHVLSAAPARLRGTLDIARTADPHELAAVDLFVCEGELGVAENGATWVSESALIHRAAPFIAQRLAIVLERGKIVWEMQEAYARISVNRDGYGVFIAGPSKTADIEQSLVIGAHGPRSLTVVLV